MSNPITQDVEAAARLLRRGGVVAVPTETVYGLGADALNVEAVRRVFAIKRRPADHPLIVHLSDATQLNAWAREVPEAARRLAARFWPGPLTLILPRQPQVPDAVTGGQDSVGLRVPSHPVARALLAAFGGGIAAPSANRYGRVSATTAAHVLEEFGEEVDLILDGGACPLGIESTIVSLLDGVPRLLRPGAISPAMLADALGYPLPMGAGESGVRVPGGHAAHYAPATPLVLLPADALWREAERCVAAKKRIAVLHHGAPRMGAIGDVHMLALSPDPAGYAHDLYAMLRAADALGAERLLVEVPPPGEEWLAVRDRLARAATGSTPTAS